MHVCVRVRACASVHVCMAGRVRCVCGRALTSASLGSRNASTAVENAAHLTPPHGPVSGSCRDSLVSQALPAPWSGPWGGGWEGGRQEARRGWGAGPMARLPRAHPCSAPSALTSAPGLPPPTLRDPWGQPSPVSCFPTTAPSATPATAECAPESFLTEPHRRGRPCPSVTRTSPGQTCDSLGHPEHRHPPPSLLGQARGGAPERSPNQGPRGEGSPTRQRAWSSRGRVGPPHSPREQIQQNWRHTAAPTAELCLRLRLQPGHQARRVLPRFGGRHPHACTETHEAYGHMHTRAHTETDTRRHVYTRGHRETCTHTDGHMCTQRHSHMCLHRHTRVHTRTQTHRCAPRPPPNSPPGKLRCASVLPVFLMTQGSLPARPDPRGCPRPARPGGRTSASGAERPLPTRGGCGSPAADTWGLGGCGDQAPQEGLPPPLSPHPPPGKGASHK